MTELMRRNLRQATRHINDAHAGLLIQRGLTHWQAEQEVKELKKQHQKTIKEKLIETIGSIKPSDLYFHAFNRWLMLTHEQPEFATVGARIAGRLYTGLPLGGTLETGATTHHSYGMPIIAGSSIKGAVRAYTERLFALKKEDGSYQLIKDENGIERLVIDPEKQYIIDILFGKESEDGDDNKGDAGYLIWHDAWWIPQTNKDHKTLSEGDQNKPFINEIVTVHHQQYYNGQMKEALDIENPIPNQQIAIQGEFYFVIEGEQEWADYAKQLLEDTLSEMGLGSKTASGYGYFETDETINQSLSTRCELLQPATASSDDPLASIRMQLIGLNEKTLIEKLSKSINKFFTELNLDKKSDEDRQKVASACLERHGEIIASWEGSSDTNKKKAYKFIQENRANT